MRTSKEMQQAELLAVKQSQDSLQQELALKAKALNEIQEAEKETKEFELLLLHDLISLRELLALYKPTETLARHGSTGSICFLALEYAKLKGKIN